MEQKIEINDLKSRLARLEAIINSSLIVDETTSNGTCMSYEEEEEDTCLSLIVDGTTSNGTCMSYEEEEEDTCLSLIVDGTTSNGACHMRRRKRIQACR